MDWGFIRHDFVLFRGADESLASEPLSASYALTATNTNWYASKTSSRAGHRPRKTTPEGTSATENNWPRLVGAMARLESGMNLTEETLNQSYQLYKNEKLWKRTTSGKSSWRSSSPPSQPPWPPSQPPRAWATDLYKGEKVKNYFVLISLQVREIFRRLRMADSLGRQFQGIIAEALDGKKFGRKY